MMLAAGNRQKTTLQTGCIGASRQTASLTPLTIARWLRGDARLEIQRGGYFGGREWPGGAAKGLRRFQAEYSFRVLPLLLDARH